MINHGFSVVLSCTAFQEAIKKLEWKRPPISHENAVSICCLNVLSLILFLMARDSLIQVNTRTCYSVLWQSKGSVLQIKNQLTITPSYRFLERLIWKIYFSNTG